MKKIKLFILTVLMIVSATAISFASNDMDLTKKPVVDNDRPYIIGCWWDAGGYYLWCYSDKPFVANDDGTVRVDYLSSSYWRQVLVRTDGSIISNTLVKRTEYDTVRTTYQVLKVSSDDIKYMSGVNFFTVPRPPVAEMAQPLVTAVGQVVVILVGCGILVISLMQLPRLLRTLYKFL